MGAVAHSLLFELIGLIDLLIYWIVFLHHTSHFVRE